VAAAVACGRAPAITVRHRRIGAVRFFYVAEPDTTIDRVGFAGLDCPALDTAGVLVEPGEVVSPPPGGTTFGRIAFATAVADSAADCEAALDAAERALVIRAR